MVKQNILRTRVPVSDRGGTRPPKKHKLARRVDKLGMTSMVVLSVVVLLILFTIYVPLRNYFQGEAEIARLEESIAAKELRREELEDEVANYEDEAFVEQQARRRLGVIRPGETAWRVIDPRMTEAERVTTPSDDESVVPKWYEIVWDSVAEPATVQ